MVPRAIITLIIGAVCIKAMVSLAIYINFRRYIQWLQYVIKERYGTISGNIWPRGKVAKIVLQTIGSGGLLCR
jgi:hypothetical protein